MRIGGPLRPTFTLTISWDTMGEYQCHTLLLRRVYREQVGFYPLPKCALRRANPWVQDLCKCPSVLPYPVPPKVKIHKMAPWEQAPPYFGLPAGLSIFPTLVQIEEGHYSSSSLATS